LSQSFFEIPVKDMLLGQKRNPDGLLRFPPATICQEHPSPYQQQNQEPFSRLCSPTVHSYARLPIRRLSIELHGLHPASKLQSLIVQSQRSIMTRDRNRPLS